MLLITGGTGFLGRRCAAHFKKTGYPLLMPSHGELDITSERSVRDWFREQKPEAVIHTAAVSDTGLCRREPAWSEKVNVDGCAHLAKASRDFGAKLVICSSDQVYSGSPCRGPHREEEPAAPNNVYGNQKLQAERKCLEILPETVCLRLSWMYSRESFPGQHGNFLATLKAALADETLPLTWPVHDLRGITDVDTVVKNLPKALELPGGVYNFGSENDANTHETVRTLLKKLDMSRALARLTPDEAAFSDNPRDISMDTEKIRKAGICFPHTLEGLLHALQKEETP